MCVRVCVSERVGGCAVYVCGTYYQLPKQFSTSMMLLNPLSTKPRSGGGVRMWGQHGVQKDCTQMQTHIQHTLGFHSVQKDRTQMQTHAQHTLGFHSVQKDYTQLRRTYNTH